MTEQTSPSALTARELIDDPVAAFGGSQTRMETSTADALPSTRGSTPGG